MNPFKAAVRWASAWAWRTELDQGEHAIEHFTELRQIAALKSVHLAVLEDLFREKQAKIDRLQACYNEKRRPKYEDLRKENPLKDTESLIQTLSVFESRGAAHYERTGKKLPHSDGTVQGVPGDQPNVETGEGWG